MARQLVLLPKVKYDKLLSDGGESRNLANEKIAQNTVDTDTNGLKHGDHDKSSTESMQEPDHPSEGDKAREHGDASPHGKKQEPAKVKEREIDDTPPPRRSMRSRKGQRGGKLFIKETPTVFQKKVFTKRKWLSFKI